MNKTPFALGCHVGSEELAEQMYGDKSSESAEKVNKAVNNFKGSFTRLNRMLNNDKVSSMRK